MNTSKIGQAMKAVLQSSCLSIQWQEPFSARNSSNTFSPPSPKRMASFDQSMPLTSYYSLFSYRCPAQKHAATYAIVAAPTIEAVLGSELEEPASHEHVQYNVHVGYVQCSSVLPISI